MSLSIRSFVKSITKTSFFMNQFITKGDETIVEAQVHLVFINQKGKPIKIPETLFKDFKPYFCDSIKIVDIFFAEFNKCSHHFMIDYFCIYISWTRMITRNRVILPSGK